MNDNVFEFPRRKIFYSTVSPKEIYEQVSPSDEMVWEICPYLRMHQDESDCHHCSKLEEVENRKGTRGCYALAQEVCRIIFAIQKREQNVISD